MITTSILIGGLLIPSILNYYGVLVGQKGVDYYGEVHTTFHNSMVHTIFMPITIYGMLLWIPSVLTYICNVPHNKLMVTHKVIQLSFYFAYMTHYITINIGVGILLMMIYSVPLYFAQRLYITNSSNYFLYGLTISTISLIIQEVFGHYYGGDKPSRPEAIFNAILYAVYFSVGHFIRYI